jgi:hypothetical protein
MRQVSIFKQKFPLPHLFNQATKANTMTWLGSNKKRNKYGSTKNTRYGNNSLKSQHYEKINSRKEK